MNTEIFRRPGWSLGSVVWLCAALAFPLHLGWAGTPVLSLVVYCIVATTLMLIADVLHDPKSYPTWRELRFQAAPFLMALAVPAAVAFTIGHAMAPADEAFEDDICRLGGLSSKPESRLEELDDSYDLTADCSFDTAG